ncbi:unnamed protein product [Caenorhabditis nigoni]
MIQTSIPSLTLIIPPFVLIFQVLTDKYSLYLMNLFMISYALNGSIESSAILSVYRPYRNAVKDILNFRKSRVAKIQTIPIQEIHATSSIGRKYHVAETL